MAATAKHILAARTQGPEAGLDAYLEAPASQNHPHYKEIVGKTGRKGRTAQLTAYCRIFADQIGPPVTPIKADETVGHLQAQMEALMERIGALTGATEPEGEPEPEFSDTVLALSKALNIDPLAVSAVLGQVAASPPDTQEDDIVTSTDFLTEDVMWSVLGKGVPRPQPDRRSLPASNAQLWRWNSTGQAPSDLIEDLNAQAQS